MSRVGVPFAILRASCNPAIVITMKVPPTHTAENTRDARLWWTAGTRTPNAIATRLHPATFLGATVRNIVEAMIVEIAAATPNKGQVQPNTAGSLMRLRATAGMNVAGIMYPNPNAPYQPIRIQAERFSGG